MSAGVGEGAAMRREMVRSGLRMIAAGVAAVILAAYFHAQVADFLRLSVSGEARFIFLGFFGGGLLGGFGILVSVAGLLRSETGGKQVRLAPVLILLAILTVILVSLCLFHSREPEQRRLRPGETITI